jgi:3-oxoacyl-[acyl-carrier protein] reductase
MELAGLNAIVTGAGRGIGRAIALELGRAGARVLVNYRRSAEGAEEVAHQIPGSRAVQADVATTEGCQRLVDTALEWGHLDIVVNNAGITADGLCMTMTDEEFDRVLSVNAGGTFRMCRAALHPMARQRSGAIVNLTSISGFRGNSGQTNYSASKAAILGMTRTLAKEMGRRKIRVNAVAPGFIETDMTAVLDEAQRDAIRSQVPLQRYGTTDEVAQTVLWLTGPGAAYVTGAVIPVDGGLGMGH